MRRVGDDTVLICEPCQAGGINPGKGGEVQCPVKKQRMQFTVIIIYFVFSDGFFSKISAISVQEVFIVILTFALIYLCYTMLFNFATFC